MAKVYEGKASNRLVEVFAEGDEAEAHYYENGEKVFQFQSNWTEDTSASRMIINDANDWLREVM